MSWWAHPKTMRDGSIAGNGIATYEPPAEKRWYHRIGIGPWIALGVLAPALLVVAFVACSTGVVP